MVVVEVGHIVVVLAGVVAVGFAGIAVVEIVAVAFVGTAVVEVVRVVEVVVAASGSAPRDSKLTARCIATAEVGTARLAAVQAAEEPRRNPTAVHISAVEMQQTTAG